MFAFDYECSSTSVDDARHSEMMLPAGLHLSGRGAANLSLIGRNRKKPGWPVSLTACQSHLKSTTLKQVRHLRDRDVPFFIGPTETKFCHWAAFRDPDGNRLVIHKRK